MGIFKTTAVERFFFFNVYHCRCRAAGFLYLRNEGKGNFKFFCFCFLFQFWLICVRFGDEDCGWWMVVDVYVDV